MAGIDAPRVLCELLITNRSPRLEDLTLELMETVLQRRVTPMGTSWCLAAISKVLASKGIISEPTSARWNTGEMGAVGEVLV
jgi:hypothetical protein